ncbi:MAG: gamma-glutamyltransferase family protein [Limnochordaceae bacterium]|nr:gamma-glutamyltransferase family protein [Limnochordaceae bacterium]
MEGGNAVDAAIATAACLVVVEPTSCGLGGDAFAMVWDGERLHGLNASGPAPAALDAEALRRRGLTQVPTEGWESVTVPGVVAGWAALARRWGSMPLTRVLAPAIEYAERGHPVPVRTALLWQAAAARFGQRQDFREAFLPGGRAPRAGEIVRQPDQARTLRLIAESGGEAMYRGPLALEIARYAARTGGYLTLEDLSAYEAEWVDPLSIPYRDVEVWELPPNGQGVAALLALGIASRFDPAPAGPAAGGSRFPDARWSHLLAESLRLALHETYQHVADPRRAPVPVERFTDPAFAAALALRIDPGRAIPEPIPDRSAAGGTVYLCTADEQGRMVSFIQSNFYGFGSGVVVPGTGIALQNRGAGFNLIPGHPNELAPGKRPFHTIIPGFLTRKGRPLAAFGVMGGDMQAQGHVQVVSALVDGGLDPQAALDLPRFRVMPGGHLALEEGFDPELARALAGMGHPISTGQAPLGFGGGQIVWRDPESGVYVGGSDPRKDGQAVGW